MSTPVALDELAEALARYSYAYLATVTGDRRAHVVAVTPELTDGHLHVPNPGRRTSANVAAGGPVTLVWPPAEPGGYSLILDGEGRLDSDDLLVVVPGRAVLHRPASGADTTGDVAGSCGSDCVEIPTTR